MASDAVQDLVKKFIVPSRESEYNPNVFTKLNPLSVMVEHCLHELTLSFKPEHHKHVVPLFLHIYGCFASL